jgi:HEAT repeat protein
VDSLAEFVSSQASLPEKHDAIQALGTVGGDAVAVLRRYVASGPATEELEVEAIRALAPRATRSDISWLAARLESPDKYIRAAAATALGRIAHPASQEFLMLAAKDREPLVRASIARALGRVSTVYASKFLVGMLKDPSPLVVSMAAWGLGESRFAESIPALKALATDKRSPVPASGRLGEVSGSPRLAAIGALGRIGTDEAKGILLQGLESDDAIVRMAAAQALGTAGLANPPVEAALEKHLKDPSDLVRASALVSLKALGKTYPPGYFQGK